MRLLRRGAAADGSGAEEKDAHVVWAREFFDSEACWNSRMNTGAHPCPKGSRPASEAFFVALSITFRVRFYDYG